jgi:hypothetical protein
MKCHTVRQTLIAYLDNEVTPLERKQIQEHLVGCARCRDELSMLQGMQRYLHRSLKLEVSHVAPSPGAWKRLQAQLTPQPVDPPVRNEGLLHRLGLLRSNHRETYRKNKPVSATQQDWSSTVNAAANLRLHQGLVLATRWSAKSGAGKQSKKTLTIDNNCPDATGDDDTG